MNKINFQVKHGGQAKHFYAETMESKLLATISPTLLASSKYSTKFLNVCYMDGKTDIASSMEHASDLIAKKYFS